MKRALFFLSFFIGSTYTAQIDVPKLQFEKTQQIWKAMGNYEKNTKKLETLFKEPPFPNVNAKKKDGMTMLMHAARRGLENIVAFLIAHGADVNARDPEGNSALFYAVHSGNIKIAKLLIFNGADLQAANKKKVTPLMFAVTAENPAMIRLFVSEGVLESEPLPKDITPALQQAIDEGIKERQALLTRKQEAYIKITEEIFPPQLQEKGILDIIGKYAYANSPQNLPHEDRCVVS